MTPDDDADEQQLLQQFEAELHAVEQEFELWSAYDLGWHAHAYRTEEPAPCDLGPGHPSMPPGLTPPQRDAFELGWRDRDAWLRSTDSQ